MSPGARLLYLNKTCFNGLYRVNRRGEFNVPWGKWPADKTPRICDRENLLVCSQRLQAAILKCEDFAPSLQRAEPGDFVYLDPPYVPASKTANFTAYTASGFTPADLERLADACCELTIRRVKFVLSNADVPAVRDAFAGFEIHEVKARRSVNCDASKRGPVGELVICNRKTFFENEEW